MTELRDGGRVKGMKKGKWKNKESCKAQTPHSVIVPAEVVLGAPKAGSVRARCWLSKVMRLH
jgi:hypothetical protein